MPAVKRVQRLAPGSTNAHRVMASYQRIVKKEFRAAYDELASALKTDANNADLLTAAAVRRNAARHVRLGAGTHADWKKTDDVWWPDGPRDRNARVLRLDPQRAELWDGPASSLVAAYEFAKAKVTGEKPDLGENRKATVEM